ncbi:MAG: hypothetical protein HFJ28_02230 [Clostridia bacterium]|nr:hypothetical protein [Clostridia bacterium]
MQESRVSKVKQTMIQISSQIEEREKKQEEKAKLENVTYYEEFEFKNVGLRDRNLYITKLEIGQGKQKTVVYEIYDENANLIATVDIKGKIHFMPEYIEALRKIDARYVEMLNLEDAKFELPEELGENDISLQEIEIKEAQKLLQKEEQEETSIEKAKDITKAEEIEAYSEMQTNQTFDKITNKQEIDPNAKVTQTETLADMIPEIKQKGFVKIGVVYSDRTKTNHGRFTFVGITAQGEMMPIESLENAQAASTGQSIMSINSNDGSVIEKEQVSGMVKLNRGNTLNATEEYLSIKIGQYGVIEVDYVRRQLGKNKEDAYFSAPVETQNQMPTTRQVKEMMDKHSNTSLEDEINKGAPEIQRDGETRIENIDKIASNDMLGIDDILVLEDGTQTTIRQEAQKAKVSPEEFLNKYERKTGKTPDEILEQVHEEIEEEYIGTDERKI